MLSNGRNDGRICHLAFSHRCQRFVFCVSECCKSGANCSLAALGTGTDLPLLAGNTPRRTIFLAMKDLVHTAIPICAPTPAPTALTIKIAARPAIVIVVTPSTLEKTARSPGENNRPTLTTTVTPTAAQAVAQTRTVSVSCSSFVAKCWN